MELRDLLDGVSGSGEILGREAWKFYSNTDSIKSKITTEILFETNIQFLNVNLSLPNKLIKEADAYQIVELGEGVYSKTMNIIEAQMALPLLEFKGRSVTKTAIHNPRKSFFQYVADHQLTNAEITKFIKRYRKNKFLVAAEGILTSDPSYHIQPGDLIAMLSFFGLNNVGLDYILKKEPDLKKIPNYEYLFFATELADNYTIQKLYLDKLIKRIYVPQCGLIPSLNPYIPYGCRARLYKEVITSSFEPKFKEIASYLNISTNEIFNNLTPDIGLIFILRERSERAATRIIDQLSNNPREYFKIIGEIVESNRGPKITVV